MARSRLKFLGHLTKLSAPDDLLFPEPGNNAFVAADGRWLAKIARLSSVA